MVLQIGIIVLAKYIFIGGVFCVVPCLMAMVTRAAADWQGVSQLTNHRDLNYETSQWVQKFESPL